MTTHKITKGLDLPLAGAPAEKTVEAPEPQRVAVETREFSGIKPKPLVKEGDTVVTGQPLFLDKLDRDVVFCSPVSGKVVTVDLGPRRFLRSVVVESEVASGGGERFADAVRPGEDREALRASLKAAGLWHLFVERPVGRMPRGDRDPAAIYVNGMDTAPLAADPAYATSGRKAHLQRGIDLLRKLTDGAVYLTLAAAGRHQSELRDLQGVEVHDFSGPHPSGLPGTHIHSIRPLRSGEVAWTLRAQDVARLGEWAETGRYPSFATVAMSGSAATVRHYHRVRLGAQVSVLNGGKPFGEDVRVIDGTVLGGQAIPGDGHIGQRCTTVTAIPEGAGRRDLFGWAVPAFGKFSNSRSVFGWLTPKKEYDLDARLNGGQRPIVDIGAWKKVTPLDIYPTYLMRAIQCGDLDEAIKLGLLEVTEEDVALCTFVDPCKIDVGSIVRQGLELYEKEG